MHTSMLPILLGVLYSLQAAMTGIIAERKGVNGFAYYWAALLLPVLALAVLLWKPDPMFGRRPMRASHDRSSE